MTYQQAQMLGAQIRKGKRGPKIVYAKPIQQENHNIDGVFTQPGSGPTGSAVSVRQRISA